MKLFVSLTKGYYHATRRAGHGRMRSLVNGLRLAWRCLADQREARAWDPPEEWP